MCKNIEILIGDGAMPNGTRYHTVTKFREPGGNADCNAEFTGYKGSLCTPVPFFGYYDWDVAVSCSACKSFGYLFKRLKENKSIDETLEARVARLVLLPCLDPPTPTPTPTPPPSGRRLATYKEEGVPKADVAWIAGMESGVTNSLGEVWITDLGPVSLTMTSFTISQFIEDEEVEINVTDIYED